MYQNNLFLLFLQAQRKSDIILLEHQKTNPIEIIENMANSIISNYNSVWTGEVEFSNIACTPWTNNHREEVLTLTRTPEFLLQCVIFIHKQNGKQKRARSQIVIFISRN